jgi:hypothetical protein
VIGSMVVAPIISRHNRPRPVARVSRTSQAARWNISPSAMPPRVVLMKSFSEEWFVSPKLRMADLIHDEVIEVPDQPVPCWPTTFSA